MAKKKSMEERVKALVAELLAEEEAEGRTEGREDINDIEEGMNRIAALVAREFGAQKLACHTATVPEDPPCPRCGHAGQLVGEHARQLITSRGEVPVTEAKYRCPKCRRHFFPSDPSTRLRG